MSAITENILEQTTLEWFESLGYTTAFGPEIAYDGPRPERKTDVRNMAMSYWKVAYERRSRI